MASSVMHPLRKPSVPEPTHLGITASVSEALPTSPDVLITSL